MPLWRRKYLLASIFTPKKGVIELADCVRANSSEGIKSYLERIVAERYVSRPRSLFRSILTHLRLFAICSGEGLVIKHPLSKYCLGARNETWIKVKPGKLPLIVNFLPSATLADVGAHRIHGRSWRKYRCCRRWWILGRR